MSKVPWHKFTDRPGAHLVVAAMQADQARYAQLMLERLISSQQPASYYATTIVREAGRPEVHLAFADVGDARKLASTVEAEASSNYPGWATEWTFHWDSPFVATLVASLAAPKPKQRSPKSQVGGRVRRGTRTPTSRLEDYANSAFSREHESGGL
jgi:hypothetical protein